MSTLRRRHHRLSTDSRSDSSSSTSPERGGDDDNDSFIMHQQNDSQSSLAPSISHDLSDAYAREIEERCRRSPICRLPAELMIAMFAKLSSTADLRSCMLVSREWARNSVGLLWHRPQTNNWGSLHTVVRSIRKADSFFEYEALVKRLNLSTLGQQISDGTLHPFSSCKRIERLTLTNCSRLTDLSLVDMIEGNRSLLALDVTGLEAITDASMFAVAKNCIRLQGLNITHCRNLTDEALVEVARGCRHVKRLKFNYCNQLTDAAFLAFARKCPQILEIDCHDCRLLEDVSVTALIAEGRHLRELRLAHCTRITDQAFLNLPLDTTYESLRILDLTECNELQDAGVQKIIAAAPRLRNLILAKCRNLTDRAVQAITKLGKNLHYIHLGHCSRVTDIGVTQLVKQCNRIRYIDLACCLNLTDTSVRQLATLPKLKRIGLVKCANITDRSILDLAKPKQAAAGGVLAPSALERVHLSYCTLLTLSGIHALLNNCPRLTHLSLTGVQAFLREELIVFCREAPPEFNDHQRNVFCVFSGNGVSRLRDYLNDESQGQAFDGDATMYDDEGEGEIEADHMSGVEVHDGPLGAHDGSNDMTPVSADGGAGPAHDADPPMHHHPAPGGAGTTFAGAFHYLPPFPHQLAHDHAHTPPLQAAAQPTPWQPNPHSHPFHPQRPFQLGAPPPPLHQHHAPPPPPPAPALHDETQNQQQQVTAMMGATAIVEEDDDFGEGSEIFVADAAD